LGENFTALRDLVPAIARKFAGRAAKQSDESLDFWALKDICLEVRKGETLGVIGHNGSGKSTMLKHFAGIMTPTKGRIIVNGRLSALIEVGAGFHPDLTGRENVFLNGVILGMSRAEVARKFDQIVEFAGLAAFIDTPVKRYSSGMYARLGFSVAAHLDPDILVIDEVLSVGDFVFRQKSLSKMRSIANAGATVIFVSHNLKAVSDLCSRTILLDAGSIVADGPTSDVIQTYLARERAKMHEARDSEVVIQSATLRGVNGSKMSFSPGDKAWVDVTLRANQACEKIAVALAVGDEAMDVVFNTSSQRLEDLTFSLQQGETATLTFELTMHLAVGTFHLAVILFRYDLGRELDRVAPAATFFIESEVDVRGAANLYPKIVECSTSKHE
jgi:lipopolysaccharide transport system ATP-binding protein